MQHSAAQEPDQDVDMPDHNQKFKEIRDRFFSAARPSDIPSQPQQLQPSASGAATDKRDQTSASASPRSHMDSVHAASQQSPYAAMSNEEVSEESPEGSKSKRELSTSKRAAQNRAAQRAFRQRKERYITELEEKVKRFQSMETDFHSLQDENHQLREYILNLQSQLLGQNKEPNSSNRRTTPASGESASSAQLLSPRRKGMVGGPRSDLKDPSNEGIVGEGGGGGPQSASNDSSNQRAAPASGESWSEHIDNLRQRYGDYPAHRPSAEGESSSAAESK